MFNPFKSKESNPTPAPEIPLKEDSPVNEDGSLKAPKEITELLNHSQKTPGEVRRKLGLAEHAKSQAHFTPEVEHHGKNWNGDHYGITL